MNKQYLFKVRDELIKIRMIFDLDIVKGKQKLSNLINDLEHEILSEEMKNELS